MKKLLLLELNEVNFDFVRAYGARGELPALNRLIVEHGLQETSSESSYDELEPWIQWVTAHTGLSFAEHGVFRLGDIVERDDLCQIWELLAAKGLKVGAVSPMNAANRSARTALFVPDPWTPTSVNGSALIRRVAKAIADLVNENAAGTSKKTPYIWLLAGLARYGRMRSGTEYTRLLAGLRSKSWTRALLLDRLLADLFISQVANGLDYATLFLNAAAHVQHHYMFSSTVYDGPHKNPSWYVRAGQDPVLDAYRLYDQIIEDIQQAFPSHRLMIATGLHQDPYPDDCYYWRLRDHSAFVAKVGIDGAHVEPRMSRDFVLYFQSESARAAARQVLQSLRASDEQPLFRVDERENSLFVELVYGRNITDDLGFSDGKTVWPGLKDEVAFVAIKNGQHNGIGYLIDTGASTVESQPVPLTTIFDRTLSHFGAQRPIASEPEATANLAPVTA